VISGAGPGRLTKSEARSLVADASVQKRLRRETSSRFGNRQSVDNGAAEDRALKVEGCAKHGEAPEYDWLLFGSRRVTPVECCPHRFAGSNSAGQVLASLGFAPKPANQTNARAVNTDGIFRDQIE
jgi:hypothetical protein